jgi:hypothetical protein
MVKPWYGGWLNALRFSVVRADNSTTWVSRVDIDANNKHELMKALSAFAYESMAHDVRSPFKRIVSADTLDHDNATVHVDDLNAGVSS